MSLFRWTTAKLESCIRGKIESQALAAILELLKESNCVLDGPVFHQLVSSMTASINSQARVSFSAAAFLKLKRRETLVPHLPPSTHASFKHALLPTPSTSSLFAEDVHQGVSDPGEGRFSNEAFDESVFT